MKKDMFRTFTFMLAVMLAFSSCASLKMGKKENPYVGSWDYVVEELPVDIDGTMIITEEDGVLKAVMSNPMGEMAMDEISIADGVLKGELDAEGNFVEFEGKFTGNSYDGFLFVQGGEFVMKMTRQE